MSRAIVSQGGSSNISGFEYDPDTKILVVTFVGDRKYQYSDVPESTVRAWQSAQSFGSFHHKFIRGKFKEQELDN